MPGILLLVFNGETVNAKRYTREADKTDVCQKWKKIYGPGFFKAEVKDVPDKTENPLTIKSPLAKGKYIPSGSFLKNRRKWQGKKL